MPSGWKLEIEKRGPLRASTDGGHLGLSTARHSAQQGASFGQARAFDSLPKESGATNAYGSSFALISRVWHRASVWGKTLLPV